MNWRDIIPLIPVWPETTTLRVITKTLGDTALMGQDAVAKLPADVPIASDDGVYTFVDIETKEKAMAMRSMTAGAFRKLRGERDE